MTTSSTAPTSGLDTDEGGSVRQRAPRTTWLPWVLLPLAGLVWTLPDLDRYYPVYDEWGMINRVVSGDWWAEMLVGFNGHLVLFDYWAYLAQVQLVGVEDLRLVYVVLCSSLVAAHVAVAALLWRAGIPAVVALLAGGMVAYFGPGAESMVYPIMLFWNLSLAFTALAGFVALRRGPRRSDAVAVGLLLTGAVAADSGLGVVGIAFASVVLAVSWPRRLTVVAVLPPFLIWALWVVLDETGRLVTRACTGHAGGNCANERFAAPVLESVEFAAHIGLRSAGGLVGGSTRAGLVVVVTVGAWLLLNLFGRRFDQRDLAIGIAGVGAAVVLAGSIAWSRTGFWPTVDDAVATLDGPSNRYVHPVAVFLMMGLAPLLAATARSLTATVRRIAAGVASIVLVAAFAANLDSLHRTQQFYEDWGDAVATQVGETVRVVTEGCPDGRRPAEQAQPVAASPQVTVSLVRELLERGALTPDFGHPPSPAVLAAACPSSP